MAKKAKKRAAASGRSSTPPKRVGPPSRPKPGANTYTSKPVTIDFAGPSHRLSSADLEIIGIYHGEASYEGRIYFNNPKADARTPRTLEHGYAGAFHVFGHGGCFGDVGHCDISGHRDPFDLRDPHPLMPISKRVSVTDALKYYARSNRPITITVVPVISAANELCDTKNVFRFEQMRFLSYNP
jgi:hypothetical protein